MVFRIDLQTMNFSFEVKVRMKPLERRKKPTALLMPVLKIQGGLSQFTNLITCNLAFFGSRKEEMDSRWNTLNYRIKVENKIGQFKLE